MSATTLRLAPMLIDGTWRRPSEAAVVQATDPATGEVLAQTYPLASEKDVSDALQAGWEAAQALRSEAPEKIAHLLEAYAERILAQRESLVELAHAETGLPAESRLNSGELPRTVDQLRQAAQAVRRRSWTRPTLDSAANIRSLLAPLGAPVAVFGPNNFPFAFNSVAGGDFAAAIAAQNPVIAKANLGHPGTTLKLAELALQAVLEAGLPPATVQLLYHMPPELGFLLVSDRRLGATGFTGSKAAGLKLKAAADAGGKLFYAELSSINPIFVLPGALRTRSEAIAAEFSASCITVAGQLCTAPGLLIVADGELAGALLQSAAGRFAAQTPGPLLTAGGTAQLQEAVSTWRRYGATVLTGGEASGPGFRFQNTLLKVTGDQFLSHPGELQVEAFGPVSLVVVARDTAQMNDIAGALEGNLTGTIYAEDEDEAVYRRLAQALRWKVGRLLNNKMPTGVAVSPAMNHGGPFPSTGHPGFTAVGLPASITRFAALHCYDNVPQGRLPPELQDGNPLHIWRFVDGQWTR